MTTKKKVKRKTIIERNLLEKEQKKTVKIILTLRKQGYEAKKIIQILKINRSKFNRLLKKFNISWKKIKIKTQKQIKRKTKPERRIFSISKETSEKLKVILPEIKTLSKKVQWLIDNSTSFENLDLEYFQKTFNQREKKPICVNWNSIYTEKLKELKVKEITKLNFIVWFLIHTHYEK